MRIIFQSIKIEGFGSYVEEQKLKLNEPNTYIVKGVNGAGKTTVFSALVWCLYGKALKDVKTAELPSWEASRTADWRGTRVMLQLSVEGDTYVIARHIKFKGTTAGLAGSNKLIVYKNKQIVTDALHKMDQQEYINSLLGMDYSVFINSVVFGQRMARLIGLKDAQKREIFEELFELSFVEQAKANADNRKAELQEQLQSFKTDAQSIQTRISNYQQRKQDTEAHIARWQAQHAERQKAAKKELDDYKQALDAAQSSIQELKQNPVEEPDRTLVQQLKQASDIYSAANKALNAFSHRVEQAQGAVVTTKAELEKVRNDASTEQLRTQRDEELERIDLRCKEKSIAVEESTALRAEELRKSGECVHCGKAILTEQIEAKQQELQKANDDKLKELYEAKQKELQKAEESWQKKIAAATEQHEVKVSELASQLQEQEQLAEQLQKQLPAKERAKDEALQAYKKLEEQYAGAEAKEKAYNDYTLKLTQAKEKLANAEDSYEKAQIRYKAVLAEAAPEDNRKALDAEIERAKLQAKELAAEQEAVQSLYDKVEWWRKVGFSGKGLKSYVFHSMLTQLNQYIEQYASRLGVSVRFSVDMEKASKSFTTTVYKDSEVVSYEQLSGGEKQRIDICLMLAMNDLVGTFNETNIMILDEVFEGIDDMGGIEEVFDLIRYKAGPDRTLFIISHQSRLDAQYCKTMEIQKTDTGSRILV